MFGLLAIGVSLISGMGVRIGGYSAFAMLMLMWLSAVPWAVDGSHDPWLDSHIIYGVLALGLAHTASGSTWGLGRWWGNLSFVQKYSFLR